MKSKNLKDLRRSKGLTQKQVSEKIDVTPEYMYMLENGKRNPSDTLKKKLSNLYDVSISEIFLAIEETKCFIK